MSALQAIALIAGREVRTRLISKATIIATVVVVVLIIGAITGLSIYQNRQAAEPTKVGVAEETSALVPALEQSAEQSGLDRSEEHTSELQSRGHLVCRLLLEKKNNNIDGMYE